MNNRNNVSNLKADLKPSPAFIQQKIHIPAGRKIKSLADKQSEIIGLRFTPSEYKIIKRRAGLVPIATFVKNEFMNNSPLF